MAVRKKKTTKVAKKAAGSKTDAAKAGEYNRNALWKAYKELQARAEKAWDQFHNSVKNKARSEILLKDRNHLMLMLAECDYMARECMRISSQGKKRRS